MKKINWETMKNGDKRAALKGMTLECCGYRRENIKEWRGTTQLIGGPFRIGQIRRSPEKAMEDAVELGRELIEEYSTALVKIAERLGSNEV